MWAIQIKCGDDTQIAPIAARDRETLHPLFVDIFQAWLSEQEGKTAEDYELRGCTEHDHHDPFVLVHDVKTDEIVLEITGYAIEQIVSVKPDAGAQLPEAFTRLLASILVGEHSVDGPETDIKKPQILH